MDHYTGPGMLCPIYSPRGSCLIPTGHDADDSGRRIQPSSVWMAALEQKCPAERKHNWSKSTEVVVQRQQLAHHKKPSQQGKMVLIQVITTITIACPCTKNGKCTLGPPMAAA